MARPYFMTFIHLFHKAQFHLHSFVYIILRNGNLFHFSLFFFFRSPSPPFPLFFFLLCFLSSSSTYSSLPLFPFSFPPFTFCFFCFLFPLFPFFLFPSISFTITNSFPSPSSFLLVSSSSNFLSPLFLLCIFSFHAFPPYPSLFSFPHYSAIFGVLFPVSCLFSSFFSLYFSFIFPPFFPFTVSSFSHFYLFSPLPPPPPLTFPVQLFPCHNFLLCH